jgi:type IV fimbrial biogenesis protein FimT
MQKTSAFTLLELLIAIAIASVLLFAAVHSWQTFAVRSRVQAGCNLLVGALQYARLTAMTRNENVIFCKSRDHRNCGGEWSDGQILITKGGEVLRVVDFPKGDRLLWKGSFGRDDAITFTAFGTTLGQQGSFSYCPRNFPELAMAVILVQTGRARISTSAADGQPITCF